MTNPSEPVDEILEYLIVHTANEYGGFEGFDDDDSRDGFNQAKQAILSLISSEVRKARVEELERLNFREATGFLVGDNHIVRQSVVTKRIAELTKPSKGES